MHASTSLSYARPSKPPASKLRPVGFDYILKQLLFGILALENSAIHEERLWGFSIFEMHMELSQQLRSNCFPAYATSLEMVRGLTAMGT
jgi:hypothetical protein